MKEAWQAGGVLDNSHAHAFSTVDILFPLALKDYYPYGHSLMPDFCQNWHGLTQMG